MLITQEITNLLNGVSQAPPQQRDSSQADDIVNALLHPSRGLRKRPPTVHIAKLSSSIAGWGSAFIYPILRSAAERYNLVIVNGDLQVYDAITGTAQTVFFPNGKAYLATSKVFRAATTGDFTVITNRSVATAKDLTKKAPAKAYEALIVVRQADYSLNCTIRLDGQVVTYTTPAATAADAKTQLGTDVVAEKLIQLLTANTTLSTAYTLLLYGSTIYLARKDGQSFVLAVQDGMSDTALLAINGTVQSFDKLPATAKHGMIVEVTGDPESSADNYFVQFVDDGPAPTPGLPARLTGASRGGAWKEVIGPGLQTCLNGSTLPHQLVYGGDILSSIANAKAPALPVVGAGAQSTISRGWTMENAIVIDDTSDYTAVQHNDFFLAPVDLADGTTRTLILTYDIDATAVLQPASPITLTMLVETGSGTNVYTTVATDTIYGGSVFRNRTLSSPATPAAGARVKFSMAYASGATPVDPNTAKLTVHGKNNASGAGIQIQKGFGRTITFDTTASYPAGYVFNIAVNSDVFTYTVPSDQNSVDVAAGIAALIVADSTYAGTNAVNGVVLVTMPGLAPIVNVSLTVTWNSAGVFWQPSLAMTPGQYSGNTIKNITDGSSGTIIGNTVTTITSSLAGGSANKFNAGDLCTVVGTGTYFVFGEAPWKARAAGDDTTCAFPSMIGRAVDEVFIYQNRLGFTSQENIVLSQAGDFYNFFRQTATDLLDNDVIDVQSATTTVPQFFGVVPWLDGAYILTDKSLMRLSGEPVLSPKTVRLDPLGEYPNAANVRPLVADRHLFIAGVKNGYTRAAVASRLPLTIATEGAVEVSDITPHVPTYLVGNPLAMAVDTQARMLFVLTDGIAQRSLYVCVYTLGSVGEQAQQIAWSRWDFATGTKVLNVDVINGVVGLVVQRSDGVYLEELTLDPPDVVPLNVLLGDGTALGDGSYDGSGLKV